MLYASEWQASAALGWRMALTSPTPDIARVMISSVMKDRRAERAAVARVIAEMQYIPWYADDPPHEFRGVSGEELSFRMAEQCDLYLLIIFPRYGSVLFPDDPRSVTHQEFEHARGQNRYKVEVFVAAEARDHPESPALRDFIGEVTRFREGYSSHIFHTLDELLGLIRTALATWHAGGQTGRNAYLRALADEYRTFRNPVTGKEMDYAATVQLKLRVHADVEPRRREWGDDDESERSQRDGAGERQPSDHRRRRDKRESRERLPLASTSPPQVARELLAQQQRLVVIGDVGAGKSTLLKRLAHDAAEDYFRSGQIRLPILVTATRLGAAALQHPGLSLAVVVGRLQEEDTRFDALRQTINRTVSEAIARNEGLLLVDGLDEANAAQQTAVFRLLAEIGANQAVLASRPAAYSGQLAARQIADLQQLGPEQRRELVLQVFRVETAERELPTSYEVLAHLADGLLQALRTRQSDLAAWGGNPLLLTLIAVQYLRDQRLPENRARIYELAIEDLQRQRPTDVRRYLTERELADYLWLLALQMTVALRRDTTLAEVRDTYLARELPSAYPDPAVRTLVAREILERSGILQRDAPPPSDADAAQAALVPGEEHDRYEFVHVSFREYLAACALTAMPSRERVGQVRRRCVHQAWEQVLLLLVNRLDLTGDGEAADAVICALMAADHRPIAALGGPDPTHLPLRMATRCALDRGKRTGDELVRQLQRSWWSVWRAEEALNLAVREFVELLSASDIDFITAIMLKVSAVPTALHEGLPLLLPKVYPRRSFPMSRWWLVGLLVVVAALGVAYVVGQITLSITLLATSGWGHWLGRSLPVALLAAFGAIVFLRLYGRLATRAKTQHEMLYAALTQGTLVSFATLGERAPVETLVRALGDTNRRVRQAAVQVLGNLGERAPVESLVRALGDGNEMCGGQRCRRWATWGSESLSSCWSRRSVSDGTCGGRRCRR